MHESVDRELAVEMVVPNQTEPGNRITIAVEVWTTDYLRFEI